MANSIKTITHNANYSTWVGLLSCDQTLCLQLTYM